jgi:hypothetical protein
MTLMRLLDLSHVIEHQMITYPGLPGPEIGEHLSFDASAGHYAAGTEFAIGQLSMVGNMGTYLDTPARRYRDGYDLAGLPLERCVLLPAVVADSDGANDLCTSSTSNMTSTGNFTTQVRASLAALHQGLPEAKIFVSSIPNIYQLWSVLHGNWVARFVWSTAGICQSMLASTNTETARQQVVAREAAFNQILSQACALYSQCRWDAYATYNHAFSSSQISTLDYFHPSLSGQAALAQVTWNASWWSGA